MLKVIKTIAFIWVLLTLTVTTSVLVYTTFLKVEKPLKQKIIETEISRIDTVYTSPPSLSKFSFGSVDTSWNGTDLGLTVVSRHVYSTASWEVVIGCIDGYQYYLSTSESAFAPRVANGPNGMIALPCQINTANNPQPGKE